MINKRAIPPPPSPLDVVVAFFCVAQAPGIVPKSLAGSDAYDTCCNYLFQIVANRVRKLLRLRVFSTKANFRG